MINFVDLDEQIVNLLCKYPDKPDGKDAIIVDALRKILTQINRIYEAGTVETKLV